MAVTSISVILTVCVLKLHHCGPHQAEIPKWMRCIILRGIGSIVGCSCASKMTNRNRRLGKKHHHSSSAHKVDRNSTGGIAGDTDVCLRLVTEMNARKHSPVAEFRHLHRPPQSVPPVNNYHNDSINNDYANHITTTNLDSVAADLKRLSVMEEILKYLKIMVAKRDEDDIENEVMNEWRQVAQVVDRFLFWIFLFFTFAATVVIMILIPLFRDLGMFGLGLKKR